MLNKVILIGNVGKDPQIRKMQNGTKIATFSLATSESWKDKATGEKKQKTEWHNIVIFNPSIIEVTERYIKSGSKVYLEGALQTRKWNKDGVDHYTTEIVLALFNVSLKLLDKKLDEGKTITNLPEEDDSIPF